MQKKSQEHCGEEETRLRQANFRTGTKDQFDRVTRRHVEFKAKEEREKLDVVDFKAEINSQTPTLEN